MADTAAALVIQLSAKVDTFIKDMKSASGAFDAEGNKIARRQAQLKGQLGDWGQSFLGINKLTGALAGLSAIGIVTGITAIVTKSLDAAEALSDTARAAGIGVERLQTLQYAASQSGASFQVFDAGLIVLNRNLGEFTNTHAGRAALAFKQLGLDKLITAGQVRDTSTLFDAIVQKIKGVGSESQKTSLLAKLFGQEAGPHLVELIEKGVVGVAELEARARALGIVMGKDAVDAAVAANNQLKTMFALIEREGVIAVASQADKIGLLADAIVHLIPQVVDWAEKWAILLGILNQSPYEKLQSDIKQADADIAQFSARAKALRESGGEGGIIGGIIQGTAAWINNRDLEAAKKRRGDLAIQESTLPGEGTTHRTPPPPPPLKLGSSAADVSLAARRKQLLDAALVDEKTANAAMVVAQDQTNVALLKGTADYYAAVKKDIDDDYTLKATQAEKARVAQLDALNRSGTDWKGYQTAVDAINLSAKEKTAAAAAAQAKALHDAGPAGTVQESLLAVQDMIRGFNDEAEAAGVLGAALVRLQVIQRAQDTQLAKGLPKLTGQDLADVTGQADEAAAAAARAQEKTDIAAINKAGEEGVQNYKDQTAQLGLVDGELAKIQFTQAEINRLNAQGHEITVEDLKTIRDKAAAYGAAAQANADATRAMQDSIAVSDELRTGLEDIGVAGLHGFKNMKQAASDFLQTLADMIIRLYIMRPLLRSLGLGSAGSDIFSGGSGDGQFSFLNADSWFASGGIMTSRGRVPLRSYAGGGVAHSAQMAMFGEGSAPEAFVPLKGGAIPVTLRMPTQPQSARNAQQPVQVMSFDLRGAVVMQDLLDQMNLISASNTKQGLTEYDRHVLPGRVQTFTRHPRRAH